MRISRLHVLVVLVSAGFAGYYALESGKLPWRTNAAPARPPVQPVQRDLPKPPVRTQAAPTPAPVAPPAAAVAASVTAPDEYRVRAGDTLWAIARDKSPVRAGAGWVGIWKANQKMIRDFDRLEAGLNLLIPQTRHAYVTRFWKPSRFELAHWPGEVDLAQLPVPGHPGSIDLAEVFEAAAEIQVSALPVPEDSDAYGFAVSAFHPPAPSYWPTPAYR